MSEDTVRTVVVAREDSVPDRTVAETPGRGPDMLVTAVAPLQLILIRAIRVYLQTLVGLLSAGGMGLSEHLPVHDLHHLLQVSAGLSLAPAVMSILQNTAELFARLDQKFPTWRA